jgi:hypothetical protein
MILMRYRLSVFLGVFLISVLPFKNFAAEPDTIRIAKSFKNGGHYNLAGSGAPQEINFKGDRILPAGTGGTYCSGFTFAVVMRAAEERGLLKNKTPAQIRVFQKEWYGVTGDTNKQAGPAMQNLGIGKLIPANEARPGDFVQLWRRKSGHSAIFLGWIEEGGKKIGFKYRSSQKSTDGISDYVEYFSDVSGKKGGVVRERTYFSRLNFK